MTVLDSTSKIKTYPIPVNRQCLIGCNPKNGTILKLKGMYLNFIYERVILLIYYPILFFIQVI